MGKILIIIGFILIATGLLVHYFDRIPFLGKLPGDIVIDRPNFKMYFPITSSIIVSLIVSLILYLFNKAKN